MQKNHILPLCFVFALAFSGCAAGALMELSALEAAELSMVETATLAEAGLGVEALAAGAEVVVADEIAFNQVLARTRLVMETASGVPELSIRTPRYGWRTLGRVKGANRIELLDIAGKQIVLEGELVSVRGAKALRLRQGPGMEYDIITTIKNDQLVIKLGEHSNGWYKVRAGENIEGYMSGKYLLPIVAGDDRRR
jgi:uncharacterized protein YgiM (DUF1202 family)